MEAPPPPGDRQVGQLRNDVNDLYDILTVVQVDVSGLKADVAELKTDMTKVKSDVAELKTDMSELKTDMVDVKTELADHTQKLDHIIEILEARAS
jgi:chromosome segregation ATPase